jgi:hypothetical protein
MGKHSLSLQALQGTGSSKGPARTLAMVSVAPLFHPLFTTSTRYLPPDDFVLCLKRWNALKPTMAIPSLFIPLD